MIVTEETETQPPKQRHLGGQDVWVQAGNKGIEHAAKVFDGKEINGKIIVRWASSGTEEPVLLHRVRPMYGDESNGSSISDHTSGTSTGITIANTSRKSRRVSNKPNRYDGAFVTKKYNEMSVDMLKGICSERNLPKTGAKGDLIHRIVQQENSPTKHKSRPSTACKRNIEKTGSGKKSVEKKKVQATKKAAIAAKATVKSAAATRKKTTKVTQKRSKSKEGASGFLGVNVSKPEKPRRISEIRRRRNDIESRVRTQLKTARKKSRQNPTEKCLGGGAEGGGTENRRLFFAEISPNTSTATAKSNCDMSIDGSILSDDCDGTVYPPEPEETEGKPTINLSVAPKEEDPVTSLYGRLELAKADYLSNIKTIREMTVDGFPEEDIAEYERWKDEAKANVNQLRRALSIVLSG
mmetsp:Transcript_11527/g.24957  ORF Transcript_11527/g.24957 Transcript_11527/m.24957 type:complete len:410 (-) Transcript_11527:8-1237(-)